MAQSEIPQHAAKEGHESIPMHREGPFWSVLLEVLLFCRMQNNVICLVTDQQLLRLSSQQKQNK